LVLRSLAVSPANEFHMSNELQLCCQYDAHCAKPGQQKRSIRPFKTSTHWLSNNTLIGSVIPDLNVVYGFAFAMSFFDLSWALSPKRNSVVVRYLPIPASSTKHE
jgi:hypothetical protein